MKYVSNNFSPKMLKGKGAHIVSFKQISQETFDQKTKDAYSIIGHEDIAKLLNKPYNRESIQLEQGDELYIALCNKTRLPEKAGVQAKSSLHYMQCKVYKKRKKFKLKKKIMKRSEQ